MALVLKFVVAAAYLLQASMAIAEIYHFNVREIIMLKPLDFLIRQMPQSGLADG